MKFILIDDEHGDVPEIEEATIELVNRYDADNNKTSQRNKYIIELESYNDLMALISKYNRYHVTIGSSDNYNLPVLELGPIKD